MSGKVNNNITVQATNLECFIADASQGKIPIEPLFNRCRIHVYSKRKRLADPDGISAKSVIDGLVKSGVLKDDSAKFVKEVSFSQEKVNAKKNTDAREETIITIEVIK